jgi:hypothetical protein
MHQVGLVEDIAVEFAVLAVLNENLRCLTQTGQQFVSRLRRENHRVLAARPVGADGMVIAVEIVEGGVRQPGFVEMQGVDLAVELFLDVLDVVEDAVIGRLGDGQHARLGRLVGNERIWQRSFSGCFPRQIRSSGSAR